MPGITQRHARWRLSCFIVSWLRDGLNLIAGRNVSKVVTPRYRSSRLSGNFALPIGLLPALLEVLAVCVSEDKLIVVVRR